MSAPLIKVPEHSTRTGAEKLAARLRAYWAERSRIVTVAVVRRVGLHMFGTDARDGAVWGIRSDIGRQVAP